MGVYIDRDELLELYANTDELDISNYDVKVAVIRQNILDMPTIDLVRCGECKHYGFKETDRGGFPCCTNEIGVTPYRMPTDFCSYGERRADDNTIKADK